MRNAKRTIIWLVLVGLLAASALSGCKKKTEETTPGGTETETTQTETPAPDA
jgi:hypothetical protein